LVKNIRKNFSGTIIVKLSPNVDDITQTAEIAIKNGADAVTIANTVLGLAIDRQNKKPIFGRITAGYSGGAIKPIALKNVYQVYKKLKCQILGSGGIEDIDDAIDFILVGAQIVQIGSANLLEPQTAIKIIDGLTQHLEKNNYSSINEIKGLI
jgi:dihydroorotate dehydrogenase (NAD+) catalytic subunit